MSAVGQIDEGFYSRQLYVLDHRAMRCMAAASVLVAGTGGLGVEIAKNVILCGVKSVTVQDERRTEWHDLSSQFFLNESHLGLNRAEGSRQRLSVLNPRVSLSVHAGALTEDLLLQFQVVVLTDSSLDDQRRFGDFCHARGIKFVVADTKGLCGQLFCDFGEDFKVSDRDGEKPAWAMIENISQGNPGVVTCDQTHGFFDGYKVVFSEVEGMVELNSAGPVEVKVHCPYTFSIGDTSGYSPYKRRGVVTHFKESCSFSFKPLSEALSDHRLLITGDERRARHATLHLAFQAIHIFVKRENRLPRPGSQEDADALLASVKDLNAEVRLEELDEAAVRRLSLTARGNLAPVNSFIGGLAAQEVLKACSQKFTPLRQWLYFDALECLPEGDQPPPPPESSFSGGGTRYDGQIAVFGKEFQEKLGRQKYFLVGAGAIGCELLKNFACVGLGAGEGGRVTLTDMDLIEKSNLNRQFLFGTQDIGKPKSQVAADAVRAMNPHINVTAHLNRLDPGSEEVYDYRFFTGLDGAAAALDNVEARVYLDRLCVRHRKPMLEGGTHGSKGHSMVVVPHLTESYGRGDSSDDPETPMCTIKTFPNRIEHTLQWAREQFEGLFKQTPEAVNDFLSDAAFVEKTLDRGDGEALEVLGGVWSSLEDVASGGQRPTNWEDCVSWARRKWELLYNNEIRQLLHRFPPEQVTDAGPPFWSGPKRCPRPLTFDPDKSHHLDFLVAAANLYGQIFGLGGGLDRQAVLRSLDGVKVPPFVPKSSVKIHLGDQEMQREKERKTDHVAELEELKRKLASASLRDSARKMFPVAFEKDDDANLHVDFIVAASNLRAENYGIPAADRHQSKGIVGNIVPAIATATAAVAGLMCLELYKLVQDRREVHAFRNAFINLAVQNLVFYRPNRPETFSVAGKDFTQWDGFLVQGVRSGRQEMTLEDLLEDVKAKSGLSVCSLFYGPARIFSGQEDRLQLRVSELVRKVTGKDLPPRPAMLEFTPSFAEDQDCASEPPIRYLLP